MYCVLLVIQESLDLSQQDHQAGHESSGTERWNVSPKGPWSRGWFDAVQALRSALRSLAINLPRNSTSMAAELMAAGSA